MENFESVLDEEVQMNQQQKRPTFLTVLCILTFVGSGIGILSGLYTLVGSNDIETTLQSAQMQSDNPFSNGVLEGVDTMGLQSVQNWGNILSLLASVLCLSGALVMWRLKKFGFILYVAGHAATIFGTYIAYRLMVELSELMPLKTIGGMMESMGVALIVITVIISVGFIVMYGLNLKAMKK